jgi:hypothetical protein
MSRSRLDCRALVRHLWAFYRAGRYLAASITLLQGRAPAIRMEQRPTQLVTKVHHRACPAGRA